MSDSQFNISKLNAQIDSGGGLASPSRFYVRFAPGLLSPRLDPGMLTYLCHRAHLPGLVVNTSQIRQHGYGVEESIPNDVDFPPVKLDFFCDNKGLVHQVFHNWFQRIYDFNIDSNTRNRFVFKYPDTYRILVDIFQLSQKNEQIIHYKLYEAFPIVYNDVQVNWAAEGLVNISVTLQYRTWQSSKLLSLPEDIRTLQLTP